MNNKNVTANEKIKLIENDILNIENWINKKYKWKNLQNKIENIFYLSSIIIIVIITTLNSLFNNTSPLVNLGCLVFIGIIIGIEVDSSKSSLELVKKCEDKKKELNLLKEKLENEKNKVLKQI